jgi:hypothetical protein
VVCSVVRECREIGRLRSKVVLQGNRDWKFGEMPCWKERRHGGGGFALFLLEKERMSNVNWLFDARLTT